MQEKKTKMASNKKKRVNEDDNPFVDANVYPVVFETGYEIIDAYIREVYSHYKGQWYLPNGLSKSILDDQIQAFKDCLIEYLKPMDEFLNYFEELSFKNLQSFYSDCKDIIKNYIKDDDSQLIINGKHKNMYITGISEMIANAYESFIEEFNNIPYGKINIFREYTEAVFVRNDGLILLSNDSKLEQSEIEYISNEALKTFSYIRKEYSNFANLEYIMVVTTKVVINIKNYPFGLVFIDDQASERNGKLTAGYYNSLHVRRILDENDGDFYYDDDEDDDE